MVSPSKCDFTRAPLLGLTIFSMTTEARAIMASGALLFLCSLTKELLLTLSTTELCKSVGENWIEHEAEAGGNFWDGPMVVVDAVGAVALGAKKAVTLSEVRFFADPFSEACRGAANSLFNLLSSSMVDKVTADVTPRVLLLLWHNLWWARCATRPAALPLQTTQSFSGSKAMPPNRVC